MPIKQVIHNPYYKSYTSNSFGHRNGVGKMSGYLTHTYSRRTYTVTSKTVYERNN